MSENTDPTALTTAQILREIQSLDRIITTRIDSMDKAVELFKADLTRVPTDLDKRIEQLQNLVFEKFNGVDIQFSGVQLQQTQ